MDNPVLHPSSKSHRIVAGGDGDIHRRRLHPGPARRKDEYGGIVEDGIKRSFELQVAGYELRVSG